jgi:nitronate monooxygenase
MPEGLMERAELGSLLNLLLEAERAGAKLLAAYLDELSPQLSRWSRIRAVQLDEARNCAVLIDLLLEAEVAPTSATGDFYDKGLAIPGWRERLEFLNRGQLWVARRIAAALPRLPACLAKQALETMHRSHLENVALCEALVE